LLLLIHIPKDALLRGKRVDYTRIVSDAACSPTKLCQAATCMNCILQTKFTVMHALLVHAASAHLKASYCCREATVSNDSYKYIGLML